MQNLLYKILFSIVITLATSCSDMMPSEDILPSRMSLSETEWEVKSNSDPEWINIYVETQKDLEGQYNIVVKAGYKSGDVVLCCKNQYIAWTLIAPNDSYYNPDMSFHVSKIDNNSLRIHFDENASGKRAATDQLLVFDLKSENDASTKIKIIRTFGEAQP